MLPNTKPWQERRGFLSGKLVVCVLGGLAGLAGMHAAQAQRFIPVGATQGYAILADGDCLQSGRYPSYCLLKIGIDHIDEYKRMAGMSPSQEGRQKRADEKTTHQASRRE